MSYSIDQYCAMMSRVVSEYPSRPHRGQYYRKRGSASYIVREVLSVRERDTDRERDRDGSDVIIVALKLAMSLHFPLPKFALLREDGSDVLIVALKIKIGDEFIIRTFRFNIAKISRFSRRVVEHTSDRTFSALCAVLQSFGTHHAPSYLRCFVSFGTHHAPWYGVCTSRSCAPS